MNTWGIDVATVDATKLIKALHDLETTEWVESLGAYSNSPEHTMIHLTTEWTQNELEDWLYKSNHGCNYIGTFPVG